MVAEVEDGEREKSQVANSGIPWLKKMSSAEVMGAESQVHGPHHLLQYWSVERGSSRRDKTGDETP